VGRDGNFLLKTPMFRLGIMDASGQTRHWEGPPRFGRGFCSLCSYCISRTERMQEEWNVRSNESDRKSDLLMGRKFTAVMGIERDLI